MCYVASCKFEDCTEAVGNGQCVMLVKALTGAPASSLWRQGEKVTDLLAAGKEILPGTAIATFFDGRYPNMAHGNHAAIFIRCVDGGIEVFDQWLGRKPRMRVLRFGRPASAGIAQRPEMYSLVL